MRSIKNYKGNIMYNIIICDDNVKMGAKLKEIVIEFFKENNINEFNIFNFQDYLNTIECVKEKENEKNIYILDVELNEEKNGLMLGMEIRKIDKYSGVMIYITSHVELSQKVFEYKLQVLEFIDKNTDICQNLKKCLNIASKTILCKNENGGEVLEVKCGFQIFKVLTEDIIYIETIKNSRKIALYTDKDRIEFYSSLKEIKNRLGDNFVQVHKTTLANKNCIKKVNKEKGNLYIEFINEYRCIISRQGVKEIGL